MQPGPSQSMLVLRWVLTALGLALAIALIARGSVLIGVLLGAFTIVRTAMFVAWQRRLRQRFPRRFEQ